MVIIIIIQLVVIYLLVSYCYQLSPICAGTGIKGIQSMVLLEY